MEEIPKLVYLDRDRGWQLPAADPRDAAIAELQAILAPLLANPYREADPMVCCFCNKLLLEGAHKPTCPVLRRDELLGRTPTDQAPVPEPVDHGPEDRQSWYR